MTYTPSDQSLKTTEVSIPHSLAPFFQEYRFEWLDVSQHQALIIERTLAYGARSEVQWLLQTYSLDQIKVWLKQSGARRLPWRRFNLWCVLFGLPPARRLRSQEQRIWPY
jgi:hypothetical protein